MPSGVYILATLKILESGASLEYQVRGTQPLRLVSDAT